MDGVHDLGGRQGFGPVEREDDEPVFHELWEGRTFATASGALGAGGFNTPMFRHSIERMDPAHYLSSGYYEHWLTGVTTLLVDAGIIDIDELESLAGGAVPRSRPVLSGAERFDVAPVAGPRFGVGSPVRVRDEHFDGHTRCPGYVRGRDGVVVRVDAAFPVPEIEAHRNEKVLEHTYGVRFAARELWGDTADATATVTVDLYERYLDPAPTRLVAAHER
jgi:nitrile hydratase